MFHVADIARAKCLHRHQRGPEHTQLHDLCVSSTTHDSDLLVRLERALREPDIGDDALVDVVVRVEDEALDRCLGVALGRRDALDDGLEHLSHVGAVLGADHDHFLARDREHVLQLLDHELGLGRGQIDLVEDRDDHQVL